MLERTWKRSNRFSLNGLVLKSMAYCSVVTKACINEIATTLFCISRMNLFRIRFSEKSWIEVKRSISMSNVSLCLLARSLALSLARLFSTVLHLIHRILFSQLLLFIKRHVCLCHSLNTRPNSCVKEANLLD